MFPSLCFQASSTGVEDVAAGAGFSDELSNTVTRQEGYQIRFYFLDMLGKISSLVIETTSVFCTGNVI